MEELKRHSLALSLVAILCIIKFIIFPIVDWQNEKFSELYLLERQVVKSETLVNNKQSIDANVLKINMAIDQLSKVLYSADEKVDFELKKQQWFEEQIKSYKLTMKNFGWENPKFEKNTNVSEKIAKIQIDGATKNIIDFMLYLDVNEKHHKISSLSINVKGQNSDALGKATMRFKLHFYLKN